MNISPSAGEAKTSCTMHASVVGVHVHVASSWRCTHTDGHAQVEARGWLWMSSSVNCLLIFEAGALTEPGAH